MSDSTVSTSPARVARQPRRHGSPDLLLVGLGLSPVSRIRRGGSRADARPRSATGTLPRPTAAQVADGDQHQRSASRAKPEATADRAPGRGRGQHHDDVRHDRETQVIILLLVSGRSVACHARSSDAAFTPIALGGQRVFAHSAELQPAHRCQLALLHKSRRIRWPADDSLGLQAADQRPHVRRTRGSGGCRSAT